MLTATITTTAGTQSFDQSLVEFNWQTRNNEGADFTATVPIMSATIVLCEVTAFTHTIVRGSKVIIQNPDKLGLTLALTVIEATNLIFKNRCEISCSSNFLQQAVRTWGSILVEEPSWTAIQERFGLQKVECYSTPPRFMAGVEKPQDVMLAAAWSFDVRHNVSVTPFTGPSGKYASDGYGIFKNYRPTSITDSEINTPLYKLEPEHIYDFNVEPAQPPVTHLQTASLGSLGPTPAIPEITINNPSEDGSDINNYVKSYYIEEVDLSAVWVASIAADATILSQAIYWSDGVVTEWDTGPNAYIRRIIGILPHAYVELNNGNSQVKVIHRETDETLFSQNITNSPQLWPDETETIFKPFKTNYLHPSEAYPDMGYCYTVWFKGVTTKNTAGTQAFAGILYKPTDEYYDIIRLEASSITNGLKFINSCKTEPTDAAQCCQITAFFTDGIKQMSYSYRVKADNTGSSRSTYYADAPSLVQSLDVTIPVDMIARSHEKLYIAYVAPSLSPTVLIVQEITSTGNTTSYVSLPGGTPQHVNAKWILDREAVAPTFEGSRMLWITGGTWSEVEKSGTSYIIHQIGNISDWSKENAMFYVLSRHTFCAIIYQDLENWNVYLQKGTIPFTSRQKGSLGVAHQIAEGNNNPVSLPFKVGPLTQTDKRVWDEDLGRIEIDIAAFDLLQQLGGVTTPVTKDVNAINIIATGSYMFVKLTTSETTYRLIKVTGFTLNYNGLLKARVSGIIVSHEI